MRLLMRRGGAQRRSREMSLVKASLVLAHLTFLRRSGEVDDGLVIVSRPTLKVAWLDLLHQIPAPTLNHCGVAVAPIVGRVGILPR